MEQPKGLLRLCSDTVATTVLLKGNYLDAFISLCAIIKILEIRDRAYQLIKQRTHPDVGTAREQPWWLASAGKNGSYHFRRLIMPIIRLPGGSLRDEIRQTIYDTIDITPSSTINSTRSFFSNVQGKGLELTNMKQNNILETAVSYRIQGLAIDAQNYRGANVLCLPLIMECSGLSLTVGEKIYWQGPMRFAAGRMYAEYGGNTTNFNLQSFGAPAVASVILQGKHVVDINPLQSFYMNWITNVASGDVTAATPASSTYLRFVCSLKGLQRRPVQ